MTISDKQFGEVIVRKNAMATNIKFSISTSGRLAMTVPHRTPDFLVRRFLEANRSHIAEQLPVKDPTTQRARDTAKKLLTKKAREYLPYRLEYLARKHAYHYDRCRLSHAGTRWGSCSSSGTISLNIGLMKLPEPLRDYVILHELAHTRHMDHSAAFWQELSTTDPHYTRHRTLLKKYSPGI